MSSDNLSRYIKLTIFINKRYLKINNNLTNLFYGHHLSHSGQFNKLNFLLINGEIETGTDNELMRT